MSDQQPDEQSGQHHESVLLPPEAIDHGERIEVAPDRTTRMTSAVVGGVLVIGGLTIAIGAPGGLGDTALVRFGLALVLVIAGAVTLVARSRRLEFDERGATLHQALRHRHLDWSQVDEARVERRYERSAVGRFARRLPGGVTISSGPGGHGAGRRGATVTRDQPFVRLGVHGRDGTDLGMDLHSASLQDGEALVAALEERGWLPADLPVIVDAREA